MTKTNGLTDQKDKATMARPTLEQEAFSNGTKTLRLTEIYLKAKDAGKMKRNGDDGKDVGEIMRGLAGNESTSLDVLSELVKNENHTYTVLHNDTYIKHILATVHASDTYTLSKLFHYGKLSTIWEVLCKFKTDIDLNVLAAIMQNTHWQTGYNSSTCEAILEDILKRFDLFYFKATLDHWNLRTLATEILCNSETLKQRADSNVRNAKIVHKMFQVVRKAIDTIEDSIFLPTIPPAPSEPNNQE